MPEPVLDLCTSRYLTFKVRDGVAIAEAGEKQENHPDNDNDPSLQQALDLPDVNIICKTCVRIGFLIMSYGVFHGTTDGL